MLAFFGPVEKKIFNINHSFGTELLTRLRLDFSHLHKHNFRHSFKDKLNPFCSCIIEVKATIHDFCAAAFIIPEAVTRGVLHKKAFLKIYKIHRKTPVPDPLSAGVFL